MTWENYLSMILPDTNKVYKAFDEVQTVRQAVIAQRRGGYSGLEEEYDKNLFWIYAL